MCPDCQRMGWEEEKPYRKADEAHEIYNDDQVKTPVEEG